MAKWLFEAPENAAVFTTRSIVEHGAWIAHVSHDAEDGSWQFHDDRPGSLSEQDAMVVSLVSMVTRDASLNDLAGLPEGWRAWRSGPAAPWRRTPIG